MGHDAWQLGHLVPDGDVNGGQPPNPRSLLGKMKIERTEGEAHV